MVRPMVTDTQFSPKIQIWSFSFQLFDIWFWKIILRASVVKFFNNMGINMNGGRHSLQFNFMEMSAVRLNSPLQTPVKTNKFCN